MTLSRRQKLTIISLLLYWPGIFILSHIPLVRVPRWAVQVQVSDKILHCLGYLILVFLLWFAISPYRKVNWRRATVWWVLFAVVWYGVFDEWLQAYVGRNADVRDFFADLAGTLTGLIALSIFPFWPAALGLTAVIIFVTTNFMRANLADLLPVTNAMFHLFGYGFFTLVWTRYMQHCLPMKAPQPRWLIGALALPIGFLLAVEVFSAIAGNGFRPSCVIVSAAGIGGVVFMHYITAFRKALSSY